MANRFKDRILRSTYAAMVAAYAERKPPLFHAFGEQTTLNGYASPFWKGYAGVKLPAGYWDRYSKTTPSYACWCAGRDIAQAEQRQAERWPVSVETWDRTADRIDGYDRDDLGLSPDY